MNGRLPGPVRFLVFGSIVFGAVVFQNCGAYEPIGMDETSASMSTCGENGCPQVAEGLMIRVGNLDPITVSANENAFDVAGDCDAAGFPTRFHWQISGQVAGEGATQDVCDEFGRWRMLVPIPAGWDRTSILTLRVIMRGIDEGGAEFDNPVGLNRKDLGVRGL